MVAFHFPPIASSAGALRVRAFADYLPDHGWQPHVLVPIEGVYDAVDPDARVPAQTRIHRAWALDARRDLSWRGRYPALLATPDRWVSWMPAAVRRGLAVAREFPIRAIWSTYPISTSHLIAGLIAQRTGLPWIAEFRDPVQPAGGRMQSAAQYAIERYVVRHSDRLVFVTEGARRAANDRFPEAADRMSVIPNGYDEAVEYSTSSNDAPPLRSSMPVVLVHSGHLYPEGRNPIVLLQAVARLKQAGQIDNQALRIVLRNSQQDQWVALEIIKLDIGDIVLLAPRLSHRSALMEQRQAHGLILLQGAKFNNQVPAKLFEYLRSARPTLALVHPAGDTAALLHDLRAGMVANPESVDEVAAALNEFVSRLSNPVDDGRLWQPEPARLQHYSRRRQTVELAALLESATSNRSTSGDEA